VDVALTEVSRPWPFISALCVALLAAAPAAAASTNPDERPASVKFPLVANHGLHARVETEADGEITLKIHRKGRFAVYALHVGATEAGLKARFGKLGTIDVAFKPTKTLRTVEPPKGCKGEPSTNREGLFVGTIKFVGERQYVRIEATRAQGRMWVDRESEWECSPKAKHSPRAPRRSTATVGARSDPGEEDALLTAIAGRCHCYFWAEAIGSRSGRTLTYFGGGRLERREGMRIIRLTAISARASTFVFDHDAGTATLRPPRPFTGRATFKRRPHRRNLWRSTIHVPLLGSAPLRVRGHRFRTRLLSEWEDE